MMTDNLKLILDLSDSNSSAIHKLSIAFLPKIQALVLKNGGKEEDIKYILEELIADLYLKVNEAFDFDKYKIDLLVMTLCVMLFKKRRIERKDRSPLIIDQDYYETSKLKLSAKKYASLEKKCSEAINNLGEPGRTIINLTFNSGDSDESIVGHVHLDSIEQLNQKRIKLLDKCIENLSL